MRFVKISEEINRLNGILKSKTDEINVVREELSQSRNYGQSIKEENDGLFSTQQKLKDEISNMRSHIQRI